MNKESSSFGSNELIRLQNQTATQEIDWSKDGTHGFDEKVVRAAVPGFAAFEVCREWSTTVAGLEYYSTSREDLFAMLRKTCPTVVAYEQQLRRPLDSAAPAPEAAPELPAQPKLILSQVEASEVLLALGEGLYIESEVDVYISALKAENKAKDQEIDRLKEQFDRAELAIKHCPALKEWMPSTVEYHGSRIAGICNLYAGCVRTLNAVHERAEAAESELAALRAERGCSASESHQLVDYVFGRPVGEPSQELGGALVTLAALATANHLSCTESAEAELARVWQKIDKIRLKQAAKPKHSPLPESAAITFELPALNAAPLPEPEGGVEDILNDGWRGGQK